MSDATVLLAMEGDVAVVHLNRPDRLNALTPDMLDLLAATLRRAAEGGARAVLLTGEGRAFCAGADLTASADMRDSGEALRRHYNPVIATMAELPIPIVAAVNGAAAGAGASIALAADIVVMAQSAYLLLAFANIGLVPDAGATWLIGKAAGRARLLEMALLGERMLAEEALANGLVTRVVEDGGLLQVSHGLATKLAAMPTVALGLIRKQVSVALSGTLAETMEIEADHQSIAAKTDDCREAIAAFLEKREAHFTGH